MVELHSNIEMRQYKLAVWSTALLLKIYAWEIKLRPVKNGLNLRHIMQFVITNYQNLRHNITGWVKYGRMRSCQLISE